MANVDIEHVGRILRRAAAEIALPRWRNLAAADVVEKNGPDDVVTVADREMEARLTADLSALMPGSLVVGEEAVHADPSQLARLAGPEPVWVIDPIDGTSAFAKGDPDFAVMVALVARQRLEAGWILAPVTGDLVCARRGDGAWRSSGGAFRRLAKPTPPSGIAAMRGITGRRLMSAERQQRIAAAARQFRSITPAICAGIEYPKLASGEADFALYNKSEPWDHLPGLAIVEEQGFVHGKHDGSPYRPGDNTGGLLVAPDRASFTEIRALLVA